MFEKNNLDWKTYEAITKYIYETLGNEYGVKIEGSGSNFKVAGKSGVNHQIDVLTLHFDGIHSYRTVIECKYWKEKINKEIVMKVAEIIEDANFNKGIIVSKNGFTQDGIDFAKYKNIGLVELKEIEDKDKEGKQGRLDVAYIELSQYVSLHRPEIISTTIDYAEKVIEKEEVNIYRYIIKLPNGEQKPFTEYSSAFQNELHQQKKLFITITKRYEIPGGSLIDKVTNSIVKIKGVTFVGVLKKMDSAYNFNITIVDEVWLIMKSLFEEKTFRISENGIIEKYNK